eukprot:CAMPEP_0172298758 /NCGR_PEP_ID=MMETSP1058-20130122/1263_1 /TAXON_ID=83371 /ORGANISM="Detonula confervacea, Strain CCMP 353" /LENGTH=314 /DNA_ID=CAMNT_0013008047 /DNA_START=61 /DNA_END=1005 /DNA_ORIENTATION=+
MAPRESFRNQMGMGDKRGSRMSAFMPTTDETRMTLAEEVEALADDVTAPFDSKFAPSDMRQLALVAHNHMKPAMKEFIETYAEILQNFRITGTQTTMRMCKSLWGEDNPKIEYGLACTSGPLGGDAQVAALMCMEDLGALIFFVDPLSAHPHQADIDSLIRLANCGNVIVCLNPTSAMSMMHTIKCALGKGSRGMIPSFFETLESPAVAEYKAGQNAALQAVVSGTPAARPTLAVDPSAYFPNTEEEDDDEDDEDDEAVGDMIEEMQSKVRFSGDEAAPKRVNRASTLIGLKKEKKKGTLKKIGKSIRRLAGGS